MDYTSPTTTGEKNDHYSPTSPSKKSIQITDKQIEKNTISAEKVIRA
jgi:hypothetical protein